MTIERQKNVITNLITITLPVVTSICALIYFVITWNIGLANRFNALEMKIDRHAIIDSIDAINTKELKQQAQMDHSIVMRLDDQNRKYGK